MEKQRTVMHRRGNLCGQYTFDTWPSGGQNCERPHDLVLALDEQYSNSQTLLMGKELGQTLSRATWPYLVIWEMLILGVHPRAAISSQTSACLRKSWGFWHVSGATVLVGTTGWEPLPQTAFRRCAQREGHNNVHCYE